MDKAGSGLLAASPSPRINTGTSVSASEAAWERSFRMTGPTPMKNLPSLISSTSSLVLSTSIDSQRLERWLRMTAAS